MSHLKDAIDDIRVARAYTKDLLQNINKEDWFRQPAEGVTCVAWQVGHLAVAQYGLAIKRVHGEQPGDSELISPEFQSSYGKGSTPSSDPVLNETVDQLQAVLDRVHDRTIELLKDVSEDELDAPSDPPHRMFKTKLGALRFCAKHEFLHAGQIALLRRLFGNPPLR